jgi:hypothetical protein
MRTTHQTEVAGNPDDVVEVYRKALRECQKALMDTLDIMSEMAETVIAHANDPASVDLGTVKRVCEEITVLADRTRHEFSLGNVDTTPL